MPTYEYRCDGCGHELELFQSITEPPKKKCPACKKSRLKRKIGGGAGFLFKGSGFYLTDYRSDSYKKAAEADSKPGDSSSSSPGSEPAKADGKTPAPAPASEPAAPKKTKKARK
jgi:putative FmdB family regulatory protein